MVYCYSQKQSSYEELYQQGVIGKLIEGFPGFEEIKEILTPYKNVGSILVLDDGLSGLNQDITRIFYELSHHANCSVFLTSQNLFYSTKEYRTISLNTKVNF